MMTVRMVEFLVFCGFMLGMAAQPYAVLLFEWLLFRARRNEMPELCKDCEIR